MKNFKFLLLLCGILIFSISANAGVQIKIKNESGTDKDMTTDIRLADNSVRIEITGKTQNMIIIFRKDKRLMWVINKKQKSYSEITEKDLKKIKNQLEKFEEQMKNMPAEQRKMMEQMMQGKMPAAPKKEEITYKKKETGIKINQWTSTHYEAFTNSEKIKDIWTADFGQLSVSEDDMKILNEMGEFFKSIAPEDPGFFNIGSKDWEEGKGFSGFPIRMISYKSGKQTDKMDVLEIQTNKNFQNTIFDLPEGYNKTDHLQGKFR